VLSPLQRQVAAIVAGLAEAEGFALAGGAALIARGDVQRETRDLDFFGLTPEAVDGLVPAVDRALREAGLVVRHVQETRDSPASSSKAPRTGPSLTWAPMPACSRQSRGSPRQR
jgi:hypothetical protein